MSDYILDRPLSGLGTSQTWLTITRHNITNVKTPGYSRQDAIQQTQVPQFSGAGYMGSGSQIVDVRRLASDFPSPASCATPPARTARVERIP